MSHRWYRAAVSRPCGPCLYHGNPAHLAMSRIAFLPMFQACARSVCASNLKRSRP